MCPVWLPYTSCVSTAVQIKMCSKLPHEFGIVLCIIQKWGYEKLAAILAGAQIYSKCADITHSNHLHSGLWNICRHNFIPPSKPTVYA